MKLYRETICKHGGGPGEPCCEWETCPGGSREEVTIDQLVFMVANACASHDMQSGPFNMLAELDDDVAAAYRRFARIHVDAALGITEDMIDHRP